jgi:hypothetical protein
MSDLKVPSMLEFANVEPFREDMFEHILDERDMLFDALHTMVMRFGHHVKNQAEYAAMTKARSVLDKINPEWKNEHTG